MKETLKRLNVNDLELGSAIGSSFFGSGEKIASYTPVDDSLLGECSRTTREDFDKIIESAKEAAIAWRNVPAPKRGEFVRELGNILRDKKDDLGKLVSMEMGKSLQEGLGEVQEMIDICDFAVGLSRQLYGLTMHSERPKHRMYEQWHPLGIVGIISAFNFPVAVWSWNSALAWVCGNSCIWKPSEKAPLCGIAVQKIVGELLDKHNLPQGLSCLVQGDYRVGQWLSQSHDVALVSATGSTRMGKAVAQDVAARLGKSLLELGGNNAIIITPNADLETALPATVFGAVGTAGQRCTSTRRIIIHSNMKDRFLEMLKKAYAQLRIGNPLDEKNHMGPLIDEDAVKMYEDAIQNALQSGAKPVVMGARIPDAPGKCYVSPTILEVDKNNTCTQTETFAPLLYIIEYNTLEEAIAIQNNVPQGLSSSIMTLNMREAEEFLSHNGSDCGIANVNIGTSGAEIGGAFGGEKETGGGRESGSDAWKSYMRRQTNTINYSTQVPLAQGIKFDF